MRENEQVDESPELDVEIEEEDEWQPPSREEWEATNSKLKRANAEAAQRRKWLEEHGVNPRTGKRADEDDETGDDDQEEQQPAKRRNNTAARKAALREARLRTALVKTASKAALTDAGWNGKGGALITRLLELDDVDVDDEGNVVGLDAQIEEIKAELPDLFKRTRSRRTDDESGDRPVRRSGASAVDGADRKSTGGSQKTWLDRMNDQFEGK